MAALGKLVTMVTANTAGFRAELTKAGTHVQAWAKTVQGSVTSVKGMLAGLGAVAGAKWAIGLTAGFEKTGAAFETMLGSGDKAKAMMSELSNFAAETPFEMGELANATKKLLAFGVAQRDIIPTMRRLGDLASALDIPLGELSEIYGKARVQGRLFAEDMNQLTGRGIPVTAEFAKQFGVAESAVRGLVEQGKIGFPQLEKAIDSLTSKGSQFGGGMQKASETLAGQWSTLVDSVKMMAIDIGTSLLPMMKSLVAEASAFADFMSGSASGGANATFNALQEFDASSRPGQRKTKSEIQAQGKELLEIHKKLLADINRTQAAIDDSMVHNPVLHLRQGANMKALEAINFRMEQLKRQIKNPLDNFKLFNPEVSRVSDGITGMVEKFNSGLLAGVDHIGRIKDKFADLKNDAKEYADKWNKMRDEAARIKDEVRTPAEKFADEMDRLDELFKSRLIDEETLQRKRDQLTKELMGAQIDRDDKMPEKPEAAMSGLREINRQIQLAALGGKTKDQKELAEMNKKQDNLAKLQPIAETLARMEKAKAFAFVG